MRRSLVFLILCSCLAAGLCLGEEPRITIAYGEYAQYQADSAAKPRLVWKTRENAPKAACYAAAAAYGLIYVITCEKPELLLYSYDPGKDLWSDKHLLLSRLSEAGSLRAMNGKVYHYGGLDPDGRQSTAIEEYDPAVNTSRLLTDPAEREAIRRALTGSPRGEPPGGAGAWRWGPFAVGETMYMFASTPGSYAMRLFAQQPGADTWVERQSMPRARIDSAVVIADGMLYTFGGWTGGSAVSDLIERYDPATDTWSEIGRMTGPRWGMGAAFVNGRFYLIGGKATGWEDETGGFVDTVEELAVM